ncbi:MAG TPA: hypothetical protein VGE26_02360 [Sphingobacteriaceae bacterium]
MKKGGILIKNLVLLFAIVFVLDRVFGSILEYYFKKETTGDNAKTRHALTAVKEDIVIFGSSRAAHHYVPEELEAATGLTCFNAGRDGMKMTYYKLLLDAILSYHKPRVIILDLNYNDLVKEARKDDALIAGILPYIDNKIVNDFVFEHEPLEGWKARISKLYQFNSKPATILHHNMGLGSEHFDGYEPLNGSKLEEGYRVHVNTSRYTEDAELVGRFEEFVSTVKGKGIELYIVYSPTLMQMKYDYLSTPKRISEKYGVPLLNYSQFYTLKEKHLFYDKTHMNNEGAKQFTHEILGRLVDTRTPKIAEPRRLKVIKPISLRIE